VAAEKRLSSVSRPSAINQAVVDGSVQPAGYRFDWQDVPVLVQGFRRMVRSGEFDVCEMAATTYLVAKEHGATFTALPVFLVRGFHHGAIMRLEGGPIDHPKQLEGRSVGVNRGYTVTTGVWARAVLQDEYGVDLSRITWVLSGDEHVASYRPPPNVVPASSGLAEMVASGELAAAIGVPAAGGLAPLIPDPVSAGLASLRRTGIYPVNHLLVVRDSLLAADPDLAPALFEAFATAKRRYVAAGLSELDGRVAQITGADPVPYGLEANRHVLQALVRAALDQRILTRPPVLEELFARGTWNLSA
jgi:4,5-dihydroxyphthalate decarboxylase